MIPGSKGQKFDASLLAGEFLTLGPAKNISYLIFGFPSSASSISLTILHATAVDAPDASSAGDNSFTSHPTIRAAARIVGCDVNELSPALDASGASTAVACKIVREMLLALLGNPKIR